MSEHWEMRAGPGVVLCVAVTGKLSEKAREKNSAPAILATNSGKKRAKNVTVFLWPTPDRKILFDRVLL